MPQLRRIWFAMVTRDSTDAGTDSRIALSINDAQLNFRDTSQDDQERGKANLYETNVTPGNINTDDLNNSAIRVLNLGADQWAPQHFIVWGETVDRAIFPLAAETDITKRLSTNPNEGNALLPLRTVGQGVEATFTRLLFMMTTVDGDDPFVNADTGTNDAINLTVRNSDGVPVVNFDIPNTSQDEQESGQANMYFVPAVAPFTRNDVSRISLSIAGEDAWRPESMFIFGLDGPAQSTERPTFLAPLVHLPDWPFSDLSTNTNEGQPTIQLPLL